MMQQKQLIVIKISNIETKINGQDSGLECQFFCKEMQAQYLRQQQSNIYFGNNEQLRQYVPKTNYTSKFLDHIFYQASELNEGIPISVIKKINEPQNIWQQYGITNSKNRNRNWNKKGMFLLSQKGQKKITQITLINLFYLIQNKTCNLCDILQRAIDFIYINIFQYEQMNLLKLSNGSSLILKSYDNWFFKICLQLNTYIKIFSFNTNNVQFIKIYYFNIIIELCCCHNYQQILQLMDQKKNNLKNSLKRQKLLKFFISNLKQNQHQLIHNTIANDTFILSDLEIELLKISDKYISNNETLQKWYANIRVSYLKKQSRGHKQILQINQKYDESMKLNFDSINYNSYTQLLIFYITTDMIHTYQFIVC